MQCPRCDGTLSTYSVEATEKTAVFCEGCGFTGIATSHEPEQSDIESWDSAIRRFERTDQSAERTGETGRADAVSVPGETSNPDIDPDALERTVVVAAALRTSTDDETQSPDSDAFEGTVAVGTALEKSPDTETDDS